MSSALDAATVDLCQSMADKDPLYRPVIVLRGSVQHLTTAAGVKDGDVVLWQSTAKAAVNGDKQA